jgi:hypothetical protein
LIAIGQPQCWLNSYLFEDDAFSSRSSMIFSISRRRAEIPYVIYEHENSKIFLLQQKGSQRIHVGVSFEFFLLVLDAAEFL